MARKKTSNKSEDQLQNFVSQIKLGESYTSLFLGAVVVIVVLFLVFSFIKSRNLNRGQTGSTSTTSQQEMKNSIPKTYTVKEGDDLWHIAQNLYGSGYNWVDLANANNLTNPGVIFSGNKLTVPDVKPKIITSDQNTMATNQSIKADSYTVEKGDYLWDIAVRAYGDGYKWVDIAKANNLTNPDLIFSGNVLKLPR